MSNNFKMNYFLFDKNGFESFYKGLLGAITFGAYNLWNIDKYLKQQEDNFNLKIKNLNDDLKNQNDKIKEQNDILKNQNDIIKEQNDKINKLLNRIK